MQSRELCRLCRSHCHACVCFLHMWVLTVELQLQGENHVIHQVSLRVKQLAHTLHVYACFIFNGRNMFFHPRLPFHNTVFIFISLRGPSRRQRVHLIISWKRWHTMPFCNPKYHYLIMALQRHYNPPWKITQPSVPFRNDAIVHLTGVQSNKSRVFFFYWNRTVRDVDWLAVLKCHGISNLSFVSTHTV